MFTREQASALCHLGHANQSRRGVVNTYSAHPVAVAKLVESFGGSETAIMAAYLHDLVEDTDMTYDDLASKGVSPEVIEILRVVTRLPDEDSRTHFNRVLASDNIDVLYVKAYDNYHNSIWTRKEMRWHREEMHTDPQGEISKYSGRYVKLLLKIRRMTGVCT